MNLHLKIMIVLGLVFLPVILATGYLPLENEKSFLLSQATRRANDLLRSIDLMAQVSLDRPGFDPLRTFMERTYLEDQDVIEIRIVGPNLRTLTGVGPRPRPAAIERFATRREIFRGRDAIGAIELTYSLTGAKLNLERLTRIVLFSVIDAFLCLGFVLHLAIKYLVTQRLRNLTKLSERIAAGDLTQRVEVGAVDELGVLARSFNNMTEALATSRAEIVEINRALEHRVELRTAQLEEQKARTEAIIASMADGLITFDAQRRLTGMNAAAEKLVGKSATAAIGQPCYEVVRCEVCTTRCLHLRAREATGPVEEQDVLLLDTGIPITFSSALLLGIDGSVVGGVETFRDIRPMKTLFSQVQRVDRLSTVGTLAAGIAHELNNPIGNISTRAQVLVQREFPPPDVLRKHLTTIASETERAKHIIQGLLDFSRQTPVVRGPLDAGAVVENSLKIVLPAFSSKSHYEVDCRVEEGLPQVTGDASQLTQVLINLLTNAFQAMPGGGRVLVVIEKKLVQRDGKGYLSIRVKDNGPGIAEENKGRLFDPFFTTKQVGMGTGLGLSVSYGIVQEHGGVLEVESQPGTGATFCVLLPVEKGEDP